MILAGVGGWGFRDGWGKGGWIEEEEDLARWCLTRSSIVHLFCFTG